MMFGPRLAIADEFVDGQFDVVRYLSKQDGGYISARVKGLLLFLGANEFR